MPKIVYNLIMHKLISQYLLKKNSQLNTLIGSPDESGRHGAPVTVMSASPPPFTGSQTNGTFGRCCFFLQSRFIYSFIFKFLLLFNYSCLPFLPIPPPHPSPTHLPLPPPPSPLISTFNWNIINKRKKQIKYNQRH